MVRLLAQARCSDNTADLELLQDSHSVSLPIKSDVLSYQESIKPLVTKSWLRLIMHSDLQGARRQLNETLIAERLLLLLQLNRSHSGMRVDLKATFDLASGKRGRGVGSQIHFSRTFALGSPMLLNLT